MLSALERRGLGHTVVSFPEIRTGGRSRSRCSIRRLLFRDKAQRRHSHLLFSAKPCSADVWLPQYNQARAKQVVPCKVWRTHRPVRPRCFKHVGLTCAVLQQACSRALRMMFTLSENAPKGARVGINYRSAITDTP